MGDEEIPDRAYTTRNKCFIEDVICLFLAGYASEYAPAGSLWLMDSDEESDRVRANTLASAIYPRSEKRRRQFLYRMMGRVTDMLLEHWDAVEAITQALLERRSIDGIEERKIIEQAINTKGSING